MTEKPASATWTVRSKVSTGYGRLDEALQGGFLVGSAIVLSAPASDEVPLLVRNFLMPSEGRGLLLCRSLSAAQTISQQESDSLKVLVCGEAVPPSTNIIPGKSIENLTELNLQINETLKAVEPKRVALDILSEVLLRHKALQTRKWLGELLARLRSRSITTLAIINPYMHAREDVEAVVDLFDGNLEISEQTVEGTLRKFLRVKWMHGVEVKEKEFPLIHLAPEPETLSQQVTVTAAPLKEPRWLTPLISRTVELGKLKAALENALANKGSVVELQGEAGVGKTRLMQELAVYARSKGAFVLSGVAPEELLPYAPWIEIAREYVAQAPGELLRRMLGQNASELVKLVPDITAKLGTIPPSKSLGEQQDKLRFYEAVTQFFIGICKDTSLLLLFDDMQYVDQPSLDLLEYFVRSASNLRVLVVTSLPSEQDRAADSPLEHTMMKFNKQRLLESIAVGNLSREDTWKLITQIFGERTISSEFADVIYHHTNGNPFFVEEVLRSLVDDGTIFRTEKGWDRKPIQDITIPKSVKTALRSRLTKLDPDALSILQWAAVIGSEFNFEVLLHVSQVDEDALLQRLETVSSQGLILEVPQERNKFRFADNRIRELLLDDILKIKRARYHLKVGEALEKIYSTSLDTHAEVIANHFLEAGDAEKTIKYSIMAGDRNKAIHAYEHAITDYRRALEILEDGNQPEKVAILEKLAVCYGFNGQLEKSNLSSEQAIAIFEKSHDNKGCARVCHNLADAIMTVKSDAGYTEIAAALKRGLKYLEEEPESFEAASIYAALAWNYSTMDDWNEANAWTEKALKVGEKSGNLDAVSRALAMKGSYLTDTGKIDEGLPLWRKALDLSLQQDDPFAARIALNLSVYTCPRDLAESMKLMLRFLELSRQFNVLEYEARAFGFLSYLNWLKGDWATALEQLQKASVVIERLDVEVSVAVIEVAAFKGWLLLSQGNLAMSDENLQKASELTKQIPKITLILRCYLPLGILRLEQGREEEAKEIFETCVDSFKNCEYTTEPLLHIETLLHLVHIYAKGGKLGEARRTSEWAKRLAETLKSDAGLAMASQAEAALLSTTGDGKGAEEAYLRSLELWKKAGWPYYHAKALVAYSEAMAQTKPEESKKYLQQAAEIFMKLGAKRDLEKAQTNLSA